jgi:hypothetical protein
LEIKDCKSNLPFKKASPWFDQQSQRLEEWEEVRKREKQREASFVKSLAHAWPLWERLVLAFPPQQADDAGHAHSTLLQVAIINMNFLLLLFLVFFAPLMLFAGETRRPHIAHNREDCASKATKVADIFTSMAGSFFLLRKSPAHSRRSVLGATGPRYVWAELPSNHG